MALYAEQPPPAPDSEPGYYPDPLGGARARWWTGEAWTSYIGPKPEEGWPRDKPLPFPERVCRGCGAKARTFATQCANCGRSYSRLRPLQMAGMALAVVLLGLGGCGGLLLVSQNELTGHEISQAEFESVELGTSRSEVEDRFGDPLETSEEDGLECITYYEKGSGGLLEGDYFDLCFDGDDRLARTDSY